MRAYRYIDSYHSGQVSLGDILGHSFVWDGDEQTEDELLGTCCFSERRMVEEYAKWSKGLGVIVVVEGEVIEWGELAGEVILDSPEVIEIINW